MLELLARRSLIRAAIVIPCFGAAAFAFGPTYRLTPSSSFLRQLDTLNLRSRGPLAERLAAPGRLTVLYWPALGQCAPVEGGFIRALEAFQERFDDTRIVSVVPAGGPERSRYGFPLPGEVLALSPDDYRSQTNTATLPRVEVWNSEHGLLLYRALSRVGAEVASLTTELERARSFTKPEAEPERVAPN